MFSKGDKVIVKKLDELIKEGCVVLEEDLGGVYHNKDKQYTLFPDFPFYGAETTITDVDENDKDIPYFLAKGIWVPDFMIKSMPEPKPEVKKEPEPKPEADDDRLKVDVDEPKPKVYINKFNNKPFGKTFCKLIELDDKIAEFSSTRFSALKKHELQYIAKLLQDHGAEKIDYNKTNRAELAVYCYNKALAL